MHKAEATNFLATLISPRTPAIVLGRGRDPERFAGMLANGGSLVFFGAPGFGKSHLADAVDSHLKARGTLTLKLRGTALSRDSAFGSLTAVLETAPIEPGGVAPPTAASFLAHAVRKTGTEHPIVAVDDAHLLDPQSAEVLCRLAADGAISLLLTSSPVPLRFGNGSDAQTFQIITSLWIQGKAERIDLEALSPDEATDLIATLAPGAVFDTATRIALYERSAGSPLLLRELTAEVLRNRFLLEDRDTLSPSAVPPSGRLLDLLRLQLTPLAPGQLHGLALLGRVHILSHAHSLAIFSPADLHDLVQRGFVSRSQQGEERVIAHSVYAEAALTMSDAYELEILAARLATTLLTSHASGRSLSETECVIVAETWSTRATLDEECERYGLDVVSEILTTAARRCNCMGISDSGIAYARRAYQLRVDTLSSIEYSRALTTINRDSQALDVLAGATSTFADAASAAYVTRWWAAIASRQDTAPELLEQLAEQATTWFPGDSTMLGEAAMVRLGNLGRQMDRVQVIAAADEIIANTTFSSSVRARAACLSAVENVVRGDGERARELMRLATGLQGPHQSQNVPWDGIDDELAMAVLVAGIAVDLLTGRDVDSLASRLDARIEHLVRNKEYKTLGHLLVSAAELAQFRGDSMTALVEFQAAESRFVRCDPMIWLPWVQAMHARALADVGQMQDAIVKLRESTSLSSTMGPNEWLRFISECTAVEILNVSGDEFAPRAVAASVTMELENGGPVIHAWLLYELFLHGENPDEVVGVIESAVASTNLPILATAARHVRAAVDQNAAALDDVASSFAKLGAFGNANLASESAAELHRDQGDRTSASLSRARASGYAESSHGANTLTITDAAPAPGRLTGRESEVALLAARGLSNRDIARALFLSVRTVESHLYQARVKLGAASRRDLGALLNSQVLG